MENMNQNNINISRILEISDKLRLFANYFVLKYSLFIDNLNLYIHIYFKRARQHFLFQGDYYGIVFDQLSAKLTKRILRIGIRIG